ncbi:hypothetical protein EWM64_g1496 [Hericium alpestre]|uniref:Uncharacterized protein n=1 Tax=Hericium alpestre TaxID=135208 RepID=A0A4Z0A882_9AGAM|nr:hypothetical protein EWM64_g1496 [Hericium alpestre]
MHWNVLINHFSDILSSLILRHSIIFNLETFYTAVLYRPHILILRILTLRHATYISVCAELGKYNIKLRFLLQALLTFILSLIYTSSLNITHNKIGIILLCKASAGQQEGGRRARPMLGLGSRQFEAALNGAGVAKPKRERQADKDGEKGKAKEGGKGRSREQRQDQPGAAKPAIAGILQRDGQGSMPRILTKPAEGESAAESTGAGPSDAGKGRSRGRGR